MGEEYGFPKIYPPGGVDNINQWLLDNGYPQDKIDLFGGKDVPCRIVGGGDDDE